MDITKEFELAGIKREALTPEFQIMYDKLEEAHKNMQGDYSKKTEELAKDKEGIHAYEAKVKEMEAANAQLNEMNVKLQDANTAWVQYFDKNFVDESSTNIDTSGESGNGENSDGGIRKYTGPNGETLIERGKVEKLEKTITTLQNEISASKAELDNKLGFTLQLLELSQKNGDKFDMNGVIKVASEKGYTDLNDAYNDLRRDDIINEKAEEIAAARVKEILDAQKASDPSGGGTFPTETVLKAPSFSNDRSRTYELATQAALNDIREARLKGE